MKNQSKNVLRDEYFGNLREQVCTELVDRRRCLTVCVSLFVLHALGVKRVSEVSVMCQCLLSL